MKKTITEFKEGSLIHIILLKMDEEIFVQCERDGRIICFPTERRALSFWENGYKSAFSRGICGATGAMVSMIQYQPRVVFFYNQNKMIDTLFNGPPFNKMSTGSINGILCQKDAKEVWSSGKEPELLKKSENSERT